MAFNTAEAQYIATSDVDKKLNWIHKLLASLFGEMLETTIIHCDNRSCVKLSENPVYHNKLKHIKMRYHYLRDMVQNSAIRLQYIPTDEQIADVFTKRLSTTKFVYFRDKLGMEENASLAEREC